MIKNTWREETTLLCYALCVKKWMYGKVEGYALGGSYAVCEELRE